MAATEVLMTWSSGLRDDARSDARRCIRSAYPGGGPCGAPSCRNCACCRVKSAPSRRATGGRPGSAVYSKVPHPGGDTQRSIGVIAYRKQITRQQAQRSRACCSIFGKACVHVGFVDILESTIFRGGSTRYIKPSSLPHRLGRHHRPTSGVSSF